MDLDAFLLPLFAFWGLITLLIYSRSDVAFFWKISISLILFFYILLFWSELAKSWGRYSADFSRELVFFLQNVLNFSSTFILLAWPMVLWIAYSGHRTHSLEKALQIMVIITLFHWLFWFANQYLHIFPKTWSIQGIMKKIEKSKLPKLF